MKVLVVAMVILTWNVMMGSVIHLNIFTDANIHYESGYYTLYNNSLPNNLSSADSTQYYSQSMNILGKAFSSLTWDWMLDLVPTELQSYLSWFTASLNGITLFLVAIGFIEVLRLRDVL